MTEPRDAELDDDLPPDLRAVARRVRELPDVEPPAGWGERLLARWRAARSRGAGGAPHTSPPDGATDDRAALRGDRDP